MNKYFRHRRLRHESLEGRRLLAADLLHNFLEPADVNDDRVVSAVDALVVVNHLNAGGGDIEGTADSPKIDVNGDASVTPLDALQVINKLNRPAVPKSEAWLETPDGTRARVELEINNGRVEFSIKLIGATPGSQLPVFVNGTPVAELQTDSAGRGKMELDGQGTDAALLDALTASPALDIVIGDLAEAQVASPAVRSDDGGVS
ncbi:MAG: hypothetical protein D6753_03625, partial [Planctomycetota bacterium]